LALVAVLALPLFTPRVYASDEIKYFAGLRSAYFDHDLHYENEYAYFIGRDPVAHAGLRPFMEQPTPTGYRLNDAPIGSAIMWAPAYVAADAFVVMARALGSTIPRDGYSWPYVWAVCLASLVWGTSGLFLCYRLCRSYVGRAEATWGVLAVRWSFTSTSRLRCPTRTRCSRSHCSYGCGTSRVRAGRRRGGPRSVLLRR